MNELNYENISSPKPLKNGSCRRQLPWFSLLLSIVAIVLSIVTLGKVNNQYSSYKAMYNQVTQTQKQTSDYMDTINILQNKTNSSDTNLETFQYRVDSIQDQTNLMNQALQDLEENFTIIREQQRTNQQILANLTRMFEYVQNQSIVFQNNFSVANQNFATFLNKSSRNIESNQEQLGIIRNKTSDLNRVLLEASIKIQGLQQNDTNIYDLLERKEEELMFIQNQSSLLNQSFSQLQNLPWPYNGYVYTLTPRADTWNNSQNLCQRVGGRLAVVGIKENRTRLSIASALKLGEVWVGINDISREGTWIWGDGSEGTASDIMWVTGQPDNFGNTEDCGELWPNFLYRMNDEPCNKPHLGLCETPFII